MFVRSFLHSYNCGDLTYFTKLEMQKEESTENVLGFITFLNNKIYLFLSHLYVLFIHIRPTNDGQLKSIK